METWVRSFGGFVCVFRRDSDLDYNMGSFVVEVMNDMYTYLNLH